MKEEMFNIFSIFVHSLPKILFELEPKKYEYIDSLRGIAILMVLLIHNGGYGSSLHDISPLLDKIRLAGRYGVQLFFLVSAYTLMLSHQSRYVENKSTRNFFIRRLFRIVPIYYIALVIYAFDSFLIASNYDVVVNFKEISLPDIIRNLFFLNNFYINMPFYVPGGWSIVAEITFYLLLPVIYKYITNLNKALLLFIVSVAISLVFSVLVINIYPNTNTLFISFPTQFPVFILGIVLFFIVSQKNISVNKWLIVALVIGTPIYIYFIPTENVSDCLRASLILFLFFYIVHKKQYRVVVNPFLSFVGKISFSMYLIHFGVLFWMSRLGFVDFMPSTTSMACIVNFIIRYVVMFVISCGLSYLSYQYVEKYFIKKGKGLIRRLS
ncbi:acyltransferase [Dysgonomonas sp. 520]|uniref:acyltransferase family protein n=1 Tax=Dysgonomonas sp. 520 TaxID=2302931 RepID=UPI0013D79FDD|nr:acyltransferase [Dysgonomonas sp. 520]NDW08104.1 acyltransferase [Dysgonomonas sp. 520]